LANFFGKPLDQIDADDILSLKDTPEGQLFEIKSELAAEKNSKDPWYNPLVPGKPRKGPGDYAKQNIFKEIIAFANSEGGWLVLGLTETSEHPKRVKGVAPLPDCHELSERFKRAAYDWIDPPLPSLQCRGIVMDDTTGKGVVVFRVPRSLAAPHRLYKKDRTQEAYKRVSDESKPMRMREIQDLTIDVARGQERIDKEFNNARERYLRLKPQLPTKNELITKNGLVGFYIVVIPLSGPVIIDRPYLNKNLFKRKWVFDGLINNGRKLQIHTLESGQSYFNEILRPILRGGRKTCSGTRSLFKDQQIINEEYLITLDIFESGIVQLSVKISFYDSPFLLMQWIIADIINTLCSTEQARVMGGMPDAEYAMEVELQCYGISVSGNILNSKEFELIFSRGNESYSHKVGPGPILLPRYLVGSINDFTKIIKEVMGDLYNIVGEPHIDDLSFDNIC
jgi:hypothetical protein